MTDGQDSFEWLNKIKMRPFFRKSASFLRQYSNNERDFVAICPIQTLDGCFDSRAVSSDFTMVNVFSALHKHQLCPHTDLIVKRKQLLIIIALN